MSWLFSQALVEEYLGDTCLDGEPSALLSGNNTQQAYCAPDKMTKFSRLSRFGMTFKLLTADRGEELLTWFLAGFPVRTSAQQDEGPESTARNPECGATWRESLGRYDPNTHTLKTAQFSLFEDLTESSPTLPRWGSMRTGELFRQPTLVPRTSESESGLWQTPVADDACNRKSGKWNSRGEPKLSAQVLTWPTPRARDCQPEGYEAGLRRMEKYSTCGLSTAVKRWPTPVASMHKGSSPAALTRKSGASRENDRLDHAVMAADAGQLNPDWVEWMMNWPIGWTSLEPLSHKQFKYWQESSAAHLHSNGMREMWFDIDPATAPQGQEPDEQRPGECGGALSDLPQGGSHDGWDMGQGQGGTGYLQSLQFGIPADTIKACDGLRPGMPEGMGANLRKSPLGFVPRTGAGIMSRSDRLRAIGNGQVPIVAATAWEILKGEFDG